MNLSGIRISAGFYDYNSIENRAVTVGSELPAELPQSVTDQAPSAEEHAAPAVSSQQEERTGSGSHRLREQLPAGCSLRVKGRGQRYCQT